MAEVDTSSYPKPQQTNPFDTLGKLVGVQNAMEQNRLLQGQQVQQQVGIDANKLQLAVQQLGTLRNMFAPHLNNPNVTTKDITQIGMDAIQQKLATPQQVATELSRFPKDGTPQQRQAWVRDMYVRSLAHEQQIGMMLGAPQGVGTGGGTTFVQQPLRPDQPAMQRGVVPNTLPPGAEIYDPRARQQQKVIEGSPGRFTPSIGAPVQKQGGRIEPETKPGMTMAPAAAPMGEQTAAEGAAAEAGKQLAQARSDASDYTRQVFPLKQAIPILEKLGPTGTGPTSEEFNQIKSSLVTLGVPVPKEWTVKDYDKAKKYLTDWVMANGNTGTNDKLAASFASNANTNISNAAAVDVAKAALALRNLKHAQTVEFEKTGLPESKFPSWSTTWNAQQDARAYGLDMMKPKQIQELYKSLKGDERKKFIASLRSAVASGVVSPPSGAAGAQ